MVRETSPKRLQKEKRFSEAFRIYVERYINTLNEGDRFISAIYMDEIVRTILLQNEESDLPKIGDSPWQNTEENLRGRLRAIRKRISSDKINEYNDDVEIAMRKRFPEKYSKYFKEEDDCERLGKGRIN